MNEHTGNLQDKWTRRHIFTAESQIGLAAAYITQLKKEKEELRIECNRLYGIGQEYDEENTVLKHGIRHLIAEIRENVPPQKIVKRWVEDLALLAKEAKDE